VSQPKPSSSSSVSFEVNPPASAPSDDEDSFDGYAAERMPTPKPMPPVIIMPLPGAVNRAISGDPTSSTLTPGNIDLLPEIVEPREDPDPPPPFDEQDTDAAGGARPREWGPDKLAVRNLDPEDAASARSSIISGGSRNSIIVRADLLREQARAEEKERDRLHAEQKRAFSEKRYPDAVLFKVGQEEASERAMNLHRRASERYFKGNCIFFLVLLLTA
jgi:hypothetical protein